MCREGPCWKRRHIEPRAAFYTLEQTQRARHQAACTLDTEKGTTYTRRGQHMTGRLVEAERTTRQAKTSNKRWTGWTNCKEHHEFPTQSESDDEEQKQGTKAKVAQAPKQPTPQELLIRRNVTPSLQQEFDKTTAQRSTASFQSRRSTSATSKAVMTATYIQPSQQLTPDLGRSLIDVTHHTTEEQKDFRKALITTVASKSGSITKELRRIEFTVAKLNEHKQHCLRKSEHSRHQFRISKTGASHGNIH